jgi:hypothetical protein
MKTGETKRRILAIYTLFDTAREPLTCKQIMSRLENQYDIKCERKAIYDDISVLKEFMPIVKTYRRWFVDRSQMRGADNGV